MNYDYQHIKHRSTVSFKGSYNFQFQFPYRLEVVYVQFNAQSLWRAYVVM